VLARSSPGQLWLYPTTATGSFRPRILTGASGWNAMTAISGAGDRNNDGLADVLARDSAEKLWCYAGNGTGGLGKIEFGDHTQVGTRWTRMTALVTPGNWDHANGNDLIARDSAGKLLLYKGSIYGWFISRQSIGTGWQGYTIA